MHIPFTHPALPVHDDLDDLIANESVAWLSERHVLPKLEELLYNYAPYAELIFKELPPDAVGVLHSDFYRTARAQTLPSGYTVEITGYADHPSPEATTIYVASGEVQISGPAGIEQVLLPGQHISLRGDAHHRIEASATSQILQVVSPTKHLGRSLLLPEHPGGVLQRTQLPKTDRLLAAWRAAAAASDAIVDALPGLHGLPTPQRLGRPLRVMFVHAHPDDDASKGAATAAKYVSAGHQVRVEILTDGSAGDVLNPAMEGHPLAEAPDINAIAAMRAAEARVAATEVGFDLHLHGYRDSGMAIGSQQHTLSNDTAFAAATAQLAANIRRFRPDIVIGYGPDNDPHLADHGVYTHPDHDAVHHIVNEALTKAASPDDLPGAPDPWLVYKHYHHAPWDKRRAHWAHRARQLNDASSPWQRLFSGTKPNVRGLAILEKFSSGPRTRENVARSLTAAQRSAAAYRSQIGEVLWAWLPYEWFRRAHSLVPAPSRETSLAAGLHHVTKPLSEPHRELGIDPAASPEEIALAWRSRRASFGRVSVTGEPARSLRERLPQALPAWWRRESRQIRGLLRAQRAFDQLTRESKSSNRL